MTYLMEKKSLSYACSKLINAETVPMVLQLSICFPACPQSSITAKSQNARYLFSYAYPATKINKSSICPSQFLLSLV